MGYYKITKRERKNIARIQAWLNDEPFQENSRDKNPQVPVLSHERVLSEWVGPDVRGAAQFFTPLEMGRTALSFLSYLRYDGHGLKILEPCAGIGHLIYHINNIAMRGATIHAFELEEENCKIGAKLFPDVEWFWEIPFEEITALEGQYDYVLMNPPFNTQRGMASGWEMSEGKTTKSQYCFLELAIRALNPGGQALIIAPWSFWDKRPKRIAEWIERQNVTLDYRSEELPGEFAQTKIRVHAYIVTKPEETYYSQNNVEVTAIPQTETKTVMSQLGLW